MKFNLDTKSWFQKKTEAPLNADIPAVSSGYDYTDPDASNLTALNINNYYISNSWVRKYVNSIVQACLHYKLTAVAMPNVKQSAVQGQLDEINALLMFANATETFTDVRGKYLKDLVLHANGALEIQPKTGKTVKELFAAPGYLLRANYDKNGNLNVKQAYAFINPEKGDVDEDFVYGVEDICHFKMDQLSDRFYGSSPLQSTYKELNADTKAIKDMERGDFGVPPQVLAFPNQTKAFVDRVMQAIQQVITGRAGNKIVSVNASDIKKVSLTDRTFKDEFEFQKWLVQRHNVYGIPAFKLGFVSETGSMSAKEQREEFQNLIFALVSYECEKLTLTLCRQRLGYEGIQIVAPELITRLDYDKARVLDRMVQSGIITPNEARTKYLGLAPVADKYADQLKQKSMADIETEKNRPTEADKDRETLIKQLIKPENQA